MFGESATGSCDIPDDRNPFDGDVLAKLLMIGIPDRKRDEVSAVRELVFPDIM